MHFTISLPISFCQNVGSFWRYACLIKDIKTQFIRFQ